VSEPGKRPAPKKDRAPSRRRLTHAATIKRQQAIVYARDVERLTWAQIAAQVKIGQKEARESYRRYLTEILPLLISVPADDKAAELLRELEEIRQQQLRLAATSANESARVGALRDAAKTIQMQFEILRSLGLMPQLVGDRGLQSLAQQIAEVLRRSNTPPDVAEEIEQLLDPQEQAD
jgi:hypothetical protein